MFKHYIWLLALPLTILVACKGGNNQTNNTASNNSNTAPTPAPPAAKAATNLQFAAELLTKPDDTNPQSDVFITYKIDGKEVRTLVGKEKMGNYSNLEKTDYSSYKIPSNAVAATVGGGFGLIEVFYLLEEPGKIMVYEGFQDEGMPDFTYKLLSTITL